MAGEAIFIGYRRDDTADVAGRIYDAMALRFGKGRVSELSGAQDRERFVFMGPGLCLRKIREGV